MPSSIKTQILLGIIPWTRHASGWLAEHLLSSPAQSACIHARLARVKSPPGEHETADPSALAQELRAVFGKLKRRLREQADDADLTPSQLSVLLRLDRDGPATASSLARAEGMRPQSMGPVIAALEAAGLVTGKPDTTDGRQTLLSLTDVCRRSMEARRTARQDWLSRTIQARLSSREQQRLAAAVVLLRRLVDD